VTWNKSTPGQGTRCPIAQLPTPCADQEPPLEEKARDHRAACFFSEKVPVAV
jgi:hypothetical protein